MKDRKKTISNVDVLIFVEDPGAANYVSQLPAELSYRYGLKTVILADGYAETYLKERGCRVQTIEHPADAKKILSFYKPRLLMIGTSENADTLGLKLVVDARKAGIASIGIVDSLPNAFHRFRGREESPLAYAPDWLIVPDQWTKDEYTSIGYSDNKVIICGHPHYDYVLSTANALEKEDRDALRKGLFPNIADDQKVATFVAEVSTGLNPEQYVFSNEYTLLGRGTSLGRTQIVLEEFLDAIKTIDSKLYMVLRLHPKNTVDEFKEYINDFNLVSASGPPLELIYASDLVVGMTTGLLLEAVIMGSPTLSIVPRRMEANWLPSIRMGLTPCATSREKIRSELKSLLEQRMNKMNSIKAHQLFWGSLERITDCVSKIIAKSRNHS